MTSTTETTPAADLEEMVEHSFPCGGNRWPVIHYCGNPAVLRRTNPCCDAPANYKCLACWTEWFTSFMAQPDPTWAFCVTCGVRSQFDPLTAYVRF